MQKIITITLEEARKYYQESTDIAFKAMLETNFGKEELLKKELPKSLEELKLIRGFWIDDDSNIEFWIDDDSNIDNTCGYPSTFFMPLRNVFKTKEQALSSLAMSELSQYMFEYNEGWKPNWNDEREDKYYIDSLREYFMVNKCWLSKHFLVFKSREIAEIFLKNFESLIKQYFNGF